MDSNFHFAFQWQNSEMESVESNYPSINPKITLILNLERLSQYL